jgi:hypothetical protein
MEAKRQMRLHHMLWHTSRGGWERFPAEVKQAFEQKGWAPPRPAQDAQGRPILDNDSGEDFLYMHHEMIKGVNRKLAEIADPDYPKVVGWKKFPAPGNPDYPVPPPYSLGDPDGDAWLQEIKSDDYFAQTFQPLERRFEDPGFLGGVSLGELGARIEFTVHNTAHMRWSAEPDELRPDPDPTHPTAVDQKWDAPSYDWLGDFYSSHVNPVFWKLHGWVDGRIGAWKRANDISGEYQWKGTWNGPMHHHMASAELDADDGEELLKLAGGAGLVASPLQRVEL